MSDLSLRHVRVLIVEDEPFIALDLASAVEEAGGEVLGPALTLQSALDIIGAQDINAAILDVNLPDGDVGPVIAALKSKGTAMVVHTGAGLPPELQSLYPDLPVYPKPTPPQALIRTITAHLQR